MNINVFSEARWGKPKAERPTTTHFNLAFSTVLAFCYVRDGNAEVWPNFEVVLYTMVRLGYGTYTMQVLTPRNGAQFLRPRKVENC